MRKPARGRAFERLFRLPLKAMGAVVYTGLAREFGAVNAIGVAFTQIPSAHREAIVRFVLYRQARMARERQERAFERSLIQG